jgi:nitroreductase
MSIVNKLIKARHTTRLMTEDINDEDVQTILDSARRAPSKNKIYGYKVFALTNSPAGKRLKSELCDNITTCEDENNKDIYLLQTKAPLVLLYVTNPAPEHQMVDLVENKGTEVYDKVYSEVKSQISKNVMVKGAVRDAMISATYAQLTAEDLGYGTAFVACGMEDVLSNKQFIRLLAKEFGDDYSEQPIEAVVAVCIGPKDQQILDIYSGKEVSVKQEYLDGETHFKRGGREESFFINQKQETMIVGI